MSSAADTAASGALDQRQHHVALLAALALFLATVEHVIPKPVPFLKLGLANLPLLVGLTVLRPREIFTWWR